MKRIEEPHLHWKEGNQPFSAAFDDVYYNHKNGLEESRLVYLEGNNLPENWQGKDHFVIAETGFGTGLNFLATCEMFERTTNPRQHLDFVSIERFPLSRGDLATALGGIALPHRERLLQAYPPRIAGFHRLWITGRISLTLVFDDVNRALPQLVQPVDAWFLDGFSPRKNPEMWQENLFSEMARLSHDNTTFGSFTASSVVRRGLKEAGFEVRRMDGYAYKYHRITGRFKGPATRTAAKRPEHVTIIGAGLAGAGAAYALQRRGVSCTVLEKEATTGQAASGNRCGLVNPKLEAQDNARTDCGHSAFGFATHLLSSPQLAGPAEYHQGGAHFLATTAESRDRLQRLARQMDWLEPHFQIAADDSLFFPEAGTVNPRALVDCLLRDVAVSCAAPVHTHDLAALAQHGPVILANGYGMQNLLPNLGLIPVRGQVTYARIDGLEGNHARIFGHYLAPCGAGEYVTGASYDRGDTDTALREQDDLANCAEVRQHFPQAGDIRISDRWAGIRSATRDHFPFAGKLPDQDGIYQDRLFASGGLGSHGIQFGLLHGEILASLLCGAVPPVGKNVLSLLSPARLLRRQDRKLQS